MASALHLLLLVSVGLLAASVRADDDDDDDECPMACPPMWTQFSDRCFLFRLNQTNWIDAETNCIALGGNLASLNSAADAHFVSHLVLDLTGSHSEVWLGGQDNTEEGTWQWSDGSAFLFTGWSVGQPDNLNGTENCMHMNLQGISMINDISCDYVMSSVCTKDL